MKIHARHRGPALRTIIALLICAFAAAAPSAVDAQYFGRNKVLWQRFHFRILDTEHFRIYYYPPNSKSADYVARIAERWYRRLSTFFHHQFKQRKPIIVYRDHAEFQQTTISSGLISQGIGGFTEPLKNRVVLPLTGVNADNNHVIGHELVHVFQFDIAHRLQRKQSRTQRAQSLARLPQWMIEGLAEYLSQGRYDPTTAMWMRDAVLHEALPKPGKFIQRQLSPYQYGQAVWAYIAGRWSDDTVRRLFVTAERSGAKKAIQDVLGMKPDAFYKAFNSALHDADTPQLDARQAADKSGEPLLTAKKSKGSVNVAPSLSPDGRWIAYLSSRQLAIDLYLANAKTGKVVRKLVTANADPHFDSLSFLYSSVTWAPDSRRFAFTVFAKGERRLAIYDVDKGRVVRRIDLPGIIGLKQPAWSPDGKSIVFSAIVDGASDLYTVDVASSRVTRLTTDPYTAIEPAFSPNGKQIVFVTDRGPGTDLEGLRFGKLHLALLDLQTDHIRVLKIFDRGERIDPHFAPDGKSLYFIADPDGVPDLFRYFLRDGHTERLTALKTGVSGFTDTSPAVSVAAGTGEVVYSVLEDSGWNIYRLRSLRGTPVGPTFSATGPGELPPPIKPAQSVVEKYLVRADFGRPSASEHYTSTKYKSHLQLADLGPASIGVGRGFTGTEAGGSFSAYFSDMLNRHQLQTSISGLSSGGGLNFSDTLGADVGYLNRAHRLEFGAQASRLPYVSGGTLLSQGTVNINGQAVPAYILQRLYQIVTVDEVAGIGRYPFSLNSRIEMSAGISHISFTQKVQSLIYPQGYAPSVQNTELPAPPGLKLQNASFAYVHDTSRFGFVSPIRGTRFRAGMQWTTGDLVYRTSRIDYRHYFFRRPLTFAFRLLHLGRRGPGADDPRLPPFDIGSSYLVRGYDVGSFNLSECTLAAGIQGCPQIDRLFGTRISVMNFELRVPLLGTKDFGIFRAPAFPTEAAFFIDAGAASSPGHPVDFTFKRNTTKRVPVVSAGIAFRTVLFGSLPIEFYYAHPYQRPDKGNVTGFLITTGW